MQCCFICGVTDKDQAIIRHKKGRYCFKHYQQVRKHGKPLKITKYDKNEIFVNGDIATMNLYNSDGKVIAKSVFNSRHLDKVSGIRWGLSYMGYAKNNRLKISLHGKILGLKDGFEIDHIDGNRLNNVDSNLRYVTDQQNRWNTTFRGYFWDAKRKTYRVRLLVNGKMTYFGSHKTEDEAKKTIANVIRQYRGEYGRVD